MLNIFKNFQKKNIEYLIVGLGNPGKQYETTRHNSGFMAVDYIASQHSCSINKSKFKSLYTTLSIQGKKCVLLKPQTFMNLSGHAVCEAMSFYKVPAEKTILIFDDISLPPGKIRIKKKGSAGGHNGVKDIISLSGTNTFPRIKIGVGAKPSGWDLGNWVTSNINNSDMENINVAIKNTYEAVSLIINDKIEQAMNSFNS